MGAETAFNNLDYIVIGLVVISGLLALMRGLVREVLALAGWVGAAYIASHYYSLAEPWVRHYIKQDNVVTAAAMIAMFIVALIFFALVSFLICQMIRGNALTAIDRSLGFVFGVIRGTLVVSIVYLAVTQILFPDIEDQVRDYVSNKGKPAVEQTASTDAQGVSTTPVKGPKVPVWLIEAKTRPAMAMGADMVANLLPKDLLNKKFALYKKKQEAAEKAVRDQAMESLATPAASPGPAVGAGDKTALDRILEQTNKAGE